MTKTPRATVSNTTSRPGQFQVGDAVYCTVYQVRGWYRVLAVRPRDGYIKIDGFNTWNPPHNFSLEAK